MNPSNAGATLHPRSDAIELRARLTDPRAVCSALGLLDGYKPGRQAGGGLLIRCPAHNERTPSCSVRRGRDGSLGVQCFGCGFTGDVLHLIAAVRGLDVRADFPAVLGEAARLAGVVLSLGPSRERSAPVSQGPLAYPNEGEVSALWRDASPVEDDNEARAYLEGRAIDAGMVDLYDLARVLQPRASTPSWARCRGRSWASSHRLILPVVDYSGAVRSLRAWRCSPQPPGDDAPKRTAPAGKALSGLILACPVARRMLATGEAPSWATEAAPFDVIIAEGEPDFLTWASRVSDANEAPPAVLGLASGSWCDAIASRIPDGARVVIWTDDDTAGHRYAADIRESLQGRSLTILRAGGGNRGQA